MTYPEKLRNPNWQKKRLEILSRDKFTCQLCTDKENELQVHHKTYKEGCEPWEYEDDNFITLCKDCHSKIEGVYHSLDDECNESELGDNLLRQRKVNQFIYSGLNDNNISILGFYKAGLDYFLGSNPKMFITKRLKGLTLFLEGVRYPIKTVDDYTSAFTKHFPKASISINYDLIEKCVLVDYYDANGKGYLRMSEKTGWIKDWQPEFKEKIF